MFVDFEGNHYCKLQTGVVPELVNLRHGEAERTRGAQKRLQLSRQSSVRGVGFPKPSLLPCVSPRKSWPGHLCISRCCNRQNKNREQGGGESVSPRDWPDDWLPSLVHSLI